MAFTNYTTKEINCKIVYAGPPQCGKTSNLKSIYTLMSSGEKKSIVPLQYTEPRTPFFDFLPVSAGFFQNFHIKMHLYTFPTSRFYHQSRKLIIRGLDGVVFVADSSFNSLNDNVDAFFTLANTLASCGYELSRLPLIIQYNKRDAKNRLPVSALTNSINLYRSKEFESIATEHQGTMETFKEVSKRVLSEIKKGTEIK